MITRPLDLASRLRPAPRDFDTLFYVNVGLLAFFFSLFGSRFVLAPGLSADFRLPEMPGARAGAERTICYISIKSSGQILNNKGLLKAAELPEWLKASAAASKDAHPALLIVADSGVPVAEITKICSLAKEAGFVSQLAAAEPASPVAGTR